MITEYMSCEDIKIYKKMSKYKVLRTFLKYTNRQNPQKNLSRGK